MSTRKAKTLARKRMRYERVVKRVLDKINIGEILRNILYQMEYDAMFPRVEYPINPFESTEHRATRGSLRIILVFSHPIRMIKGERMEKHGPNRLLFTVYQAPS